MLDGFARRELSAEFWVGKYLSKNIISTYISISQWRNVILNVWLKIILTTYLKIWNIHYNWGNSFFCPMNKKMISTHTELLCWKMSSFVLQNVHMAPKVYVLSRSYFDCLGYFRFVPFLFTNSALGALIW